MKIEFDIFNREFFRTLAFSLKISKESTIFYHIHEKYSVSSTFLYNGNLKCYVVRILYVISFQWSKCFGYRRQQIILKLTITDSRCWQSGTTVTWILISGLSCNKLSHYKHKLILWYWTNNYFLMGFIASKMYFYFGKISMFWNLNATISHEFQYLNYSKH
jgi:hypothetical protein